MRSMVRWGLGLAKGKDGELSSLRLDGYLRNYEYYRIPNNLVTIIG